MIKINGREYAIQNITVTELLHNMDYDRKKVAIELNGRILPRTEYDNTTLKEGDAVEIVSFVGGG